MVKDPKPILTAFSKLFSIFKPKQNALSKPPPPPPGTTTSSSYSATASMSSYGAFASLGAGDVNLVREYDGGQGLDGDELGLGLVGDPPSSPNNNIPPLA